MNKHCRQICSYTFAITTGCFSFIPEEFFSDVYSWAFLSEYWSDAINRILFLLLVGILTGGIVFVWKHCRKKITISGSNYKIDVEYGDILEQTKCKKVINFDECYTTEIGDAIHQIKPTSLCGQFLQKHTVDISSLLSNNSLKPARKYSEYNGKICYESGSLLPYGEFLLMAFGKLDKNGRAVMSRDEYLSCLNTFWKEIDKYYAQTDVAIPVLGAGLTRFEGEILSQQQLVDIIIYSYRLSPYKIKSPNTLRIICRKNDDFSLDKIGGNL